MKTIRISLLGIIIFTSACSIIKRENTNTKTLFTVGNKEVPAEEFEYVYSKNNFYADSLNNREAIDDYLELYINFKLKIAEAEALQMDQNPTFLNELNGYTEQLAAPYLTENKLIDALAEEAYHRLEYEVNAAHLLIKVPETASPEDTLKSWNKIQEIRQEALNGKDFSELAKEYSNDPSAKQNGGDLGYFSAFQMVYPFEGAAFKTPVGTISEPIRSRFGYHLIHVKDKRLSQGQLRAAHLMIRSTKGMPAEDAQRAKEKAFEIHKKLQQGESWAELCSQFSDDFNSRKNEGLLVWFGTGDMPPAFEKAAFALTENNTFSQPIQTAYGWHIIRLIDRKGLDSYEAMKEELKKKVTNNSRSQSNKKELIARLKKENNFKSNLTLIREVLVLADSSLASGSWESTENNDLLKESIFSINEELFYSQDLLDYIKTQIRAKKGLTSNELNKIYEKFTEDRILAYEKAHLVEKFPDYGMLLNEYREGILLFQLMDDKVWSAAVKDSTGLHNYYEKNKAQYQWEERAQAFIFHAENPEIITSIKSDLNEGDALWKTDKNEFQILRTKLESKYNTKTPLNLQLEEGLFEMAKDPQGVFSQTEKAVGNYEFEQQGRHYYVLITEVLPPMQKELKEIRGNVISDYQDHLEAEWVKTLKLQYPVSVNNSELEKVYKRFEKN